MGRLLLVIGNCNTAASVAVNHDQGPAARSPDYNFDTANNSLGPLTLRYMVYIGIFVGYEIRWLRTHVLTNKRSFLFWVRYAVDAVFLGVLGAENQIDQPLDGPGFNIIRNLAAAAKKGKR